MAQVLTGVTLHGLDAVLKAVELSLEAGHASGDHVLNVLSRLKAMKQPMRLESVDTPLTLLRPPQANVSQYDSLRAQTSAQEQEAGHDQ